MKNRIIQNICRYSLSLNTMATFELILYAYILEIISISISFAYILLFIQKTNIFMGKNTQNSNNNQILQPIFFWLILSFAIIVKFAIIYQIQKPGAKYSGKLIIFIGLNLSDNLIYFIDCFLLSQLSNSFVQLKFQKQFFSIFICIVNWILSLFIKFMNYIIISNYSYISHNPYKQKSNLKYFFLSQLLRTISYVTIFINNKFLFPVLISCFCLLNTFQLKNQIKEKPIINQIISTKKNLKISFMAATFIIYMFNYFFNIPKINAIASLIIIGLFLFLSMNNFTKHKIQLLLNSTTQEIQSQDSSFIKLQAINQLVNNQQVESNVKLTLIIKNHQKQCLNIDCVCKKHKISLRDFRKQNSIAIITQQQQRKIFYKYFLLQLSLDSKNKLENYMQPEIMYISALSLLHIYPKMLKEISSFNQWFSHQINFCQQNILFFLKQQALTELNINNQKSNILKIEYLKEIDVKIASLNVMIQNHSKNKWAAWNQLTKGNIQIQNFQNILKKDIYSEQKIIKTYTQLIQGQYVSSRRLFKTMLIFSNFILKDSFLQRQIKSDAMKYQRSDDKLDGIKINGKSISLIQNDDVCLIKISSQRQFLGRITWHSKNLQQFFGYKINKQFKDENVSILMPDIYGKHHQNYLQRWFDNPRSKKLNVFSNIYIKKYNKNYVKASLYLKILPTTQYFQILGLIHSYSDPNQQSQSFILLNQNLQTLNRVSFLTSTVSYFSSTSFKQPLQISLLSSDFIDKFIYKEKYITKNIQEQNYEKINIKLTIPKNYDELLVRFKKSLKELLKKKNQVIQKDQLRQRIFNLKLYYNSIIQTSKQTIQFQIQAQLYHFVIQNQIYYVLDHFDFLQKNHKSLLKQSNGKQVSNNSQRFHMENNLSNEDQTALNFNFDLDDQPKLLKIDKITNQNQSFHGSSLGSHSAASIKKQMNQGALINKGLIQIKKISIIFFILFLVCIIIRLLLSQLLLQMYKNVCLNQSNSSDIYQLSQLLYGYSLTTYNLMKYQKQDSKYTEDLNFYKKFSSFMEKQLIHLTKDANQAYNGITDQKFGLNINQFIMEKLQFFIYQPSVLSKNITVSSTLFLRSWIVNLQQNIQKLYNGLSLDNNDDINNQQQLKNFQSLSKQSHQLINQYEKLGQSALYQFATVSFSCFVIIIILLLLYILIMNYYIYKRNQFINSIFSIFQLISSQIRIKYASYYQYCYKHHNELFQWTTTDPQSFTLNITPTPIPIQTSTHIIAQTQNQITTTNIKEGSVFNLKIIFSIKYRLIVSIIIFCGIVLGQSIIFIQNESIKQSSYISLLLMDNILQAQNYIIQSMIDTKQYIVGINNLNDTIIIKKFINTYYQTQITFIQSTSLILRQIQKQFKNQNPKFLYLIVDDICQLTHDILLDWQYQQCIKFPSPILKTGILSTINYYQRILYSGFQNISNSIMNISEQIIPDKTLFFQFRIYQLIQQEIIILIMRYAENIDKILTVSSSIGFLILLLSSYFLYDYFRKQQNNYKLMFGYLILIPQQEYEKQQSLGRGLILVQGGFCRRQV